MESSYRKLAIAITINTIIMFFLTYVMIDSLTHFQVNINRTYMALIMAAPMVIVMLLVMRSMFMNKRLNAILLVTFSLLTILLFIFIRTQTPVGDEQFLRSMIPHHSGAILMCEQSTITDPEIIELCDEIVQTQKEEISQMESILQRLR
jgi:hypothetical protein